MGYSPGRTLIYKGQGFLSYLLGVKNEILVPLRVFRLKSCTAEAFAVPVHTVIHFKPRPQNGILLPLRDCFPNFQQAPLSYIYMGVPPPPPGVHRQGLLHEPSTAPLGSLFTGYEYEKQTNKKKEITEMFTPSALKRNNRQLLENQSHLINKQMTDAHDNFSQKILSPIDNLVHPRVP